MNLGSGDNRAMKKDTDLRITIIGLGNLMEAILPCIVETIGKENLCRQVNATTKDQPDLKRKQEALGISVILNDNLAALKKMEPDIIFFAPPPHAAPEIIRNALKDYVNCIRKESASFPEIYAFPPTPAGAFYEEVLGKDIRVVNILPHPVRIIGGKPLRGEGFYSRTFHGSWPQESAARLKRIFGSMGEGIELKPDEIAPMMGAWIMLEVLSEVVTTIADTMKEKGRPIDHRILSKYMRSKAQPVLDGSHERSGISGTEPIDAPLQLFLDNVTLAWYEGIKNYFQEHGFPSKLSMRILNLLMDFQLHILEIEDRQAVDNNTAIAATKGGVLEKGIYCYHQTIEGNLKNAIKQMPEKPAEKWREVLSGQVTEAADVVRKHGMTLGG
jgi:pyrroline-5-carboxylate reductase